MSRELQGLVWSADVVGFSTHTADEQVAIIQTISDWLGELAWLASLRRDREVFVHGTGDGFLVTFRHRDDVPWKVVEATGALVRYTRSMRERYTTAPRFAIRQGLHVGTFVYPVSLFGNTESVGDGLNLGSYVAAAAGPDQVYVSRNFVDYMVSVYGAEAERRLHLHPPLGSAAFQVPIKHGRLVGVHHLGLPGVDWSRMSPTLTRLYETQQRLEEQLRLILQAIEGSLVTEDVDPEALATRVAIWSARHDRAVPTPLRRQTSGAARPLPAGPMRLAPPSGPIAGAIAEERPIVVVGPPGAVLAVPFRFGSDGVRGAISVDFAARLEGSAGVLGLLGRIIQEREAEHVAALLQLRRA